MYLRDPINSRLALSMMAVDGTDGCCSRGKRGDVSKHQMMAVDGTDGCCSRGKRGEREESVSKHQMMIDD